MFYNVHANAYAKRTFIQSVIVKYFFERYKHYYDKPWDDL